MRFLISHVWRAKIIPTKQPAPFPWASGIDEVNLDSVAWPNAHLINLGNDKTSSAVCYHQHCCSNSAALHELEARFLKYDDVDNVNVAVVASSDVGRSSR